MGGHGESRNLDNLPWRAAEVCKLARGIWKNFLQKTVVPIDVSTENTHRNGECSYRLRACGRHAITGP